MKKLISVFLSFALLFSVSGASLAAKSDDTAADKQSQQRKEKALKVMEQLNEYRANKLLQQEKQGKTYDAAAQVNDPVEARFEGELKNLGVEELSTAEVQAEFGDGGDVGALVTTPPSTSAIKWYSINYSITRNGTTYALQDLYAQGLNGNSNLATGANGATLYTGKQILVKNLSNIGSIYVQKVVGGVLGLVPVVNWLPWELLFTSNDNVTNNSHVVTHRSLSTVCFTYVKLSGQSDSYQSMTFRSNMISIASSHTLAGYNAGAPYTKSTDKSNTSYAENYASGSKAVDSYLNTSTQRQSYITYYSFYNHDKTAKLTYYPINPAFPAHIY